MSDTWFDRCVTIAITLAFAIGLSIYVKRYQKPLVTSFTCEPDFQAPKGSVVNCNDGTKIEVFGQDCQRIVEQEGELLFFCKDNIIRILRPKTFTVTRK